MRKLLSLLIALIIFMISCKQNKDTTWGQTEITKWQGDKKGAVSITYDDGSPNQFKNALPIMRKLGLPATFFVITGPIEGSKYKPKFIGRPVKEIIKEAANVPTDSQNYFERASASKYLNYTGALPYYDKSAAYFESGHRQKAYKVMDSLYKGIHNGKLKQGPELTMEMRDEQGLSWDSIRQYASEGYEFASHTVSHTHLAVLDTANIAYELGKSKEELKNQLSSQYTFAAEIPFGVENPRAMKYGLPYYAALRNLMTDSFMTEINRGYKKEPASSNKPYVQWQRGPLTNTPYSLMKSWVDTTLAHNNIWLVLVIHGVDGIGWEPLTSEELSRYFQFIKSHEDSLWIAPFGIAARYMRERMNTKLQSRKDENKITITPKLSLDSSVYNIPLTLKTYVPDTWKHIQVRQKNKLIAISKAGKDKKGNYVMYEASPDNNPIEVFENQ